VMMGYLEPPDGDPGLDAQGFHATGDLMVRNASGDYFIRGRKKELYKNRKGQTIAPQRVESLLCGLDAISQAFLVGDRRELSTLLIWPDFEGHPELKAMPREALQARLGSLVAAANRFLAPYERVVAFAVLDRPLDTEHGELTAKGTFKREVVESHFRHLIEPMYEAARLSFPVGALTLTLPNWLLRELGLLRQDVRLDAGALLTVLPSPEAPGAVQIGDYCYLSADGAIDLGALLATPLLWLGNEGLRRFLSAGQLLALGSRKREPARGLSAVTRLAPPLDNDSVGYLAHLLDAASAEEPTLASLHAAAALIRPASPAELALRGLTHLEALLSKWGTQAPTAMPVSARPATAEDQEEREKPGAEVLSIVQSGGAGEALADGRGTSPGDPLEPVVGGKRRYVALCRALLGRGAEVPHERLRQRAFASLLSSGEPQEAPAMLRRFLGEAGLSLLSETLLATIAERALPDALITALIATLEGGAPADDGPERRTLLGAMKILSAYAVQHPSWYARVRLPLARLAVSDETLVAACAGEELDRLQLGFRSWLGPNQRLAVDPDSGREYGWREAVELDSSVDETDREHLLRAIAETTLVREAVFLFGQGALINLSCIAPGSARVSALAKDPWKSVYRLSIRVRSGETHEVAVNLAQSVPPFALREEVRWLQAAGQPPPLVEAFGGFFPGHGVFTEEYIPGETVEAQLERLARLGEAHRLAALWPFHGPGGARSVLGA
jgi:long-chain acyl-CoA synthetase